MRGSDVNWPADEARDGAPDRTGGSRLLLDDLLAKRDHVEVPAPVPPQLAIDPVPLTAAGDLGRKGVRQRLSEVEEIAWHNLRSAEEARRALDEEHRRLQQEATARARFQEEAAALRRELERLRSTEVQRAEHEKTRATRAARSEIAAELKRFHDEHERVLAELDRLRSAMHDHDGLIEDYGHRLREEQQARATLRSELDRADAERRLAERALERAMETSKQRAEDELIQVATLESQLSDTRSDRERLTAQLAERDEEIVRLRTELAAVAPPAPPEETPPRPPLARRTKKTPIQDAPQLPMRRKHTAEPPAAPVEALAPVDPVEAESEPEPGPEPSEPETADSAPQYRRSAMAELTAIAVRR